MVLRTEEQIMASWNRRDHVVVSVICAAYNHAGYIRDAIEGILSQATNFAFELIIHDDASTDDTPRIIADFALQYPHIMKPILQKENQYSKGQRILGIMMKVAIGRYIAICDGDDYWDDPTKLQQQVDFLENNPDYALVYGDLISIDKDGNRLNLDFGGSRRDLSRGDLINIVVGIHTSTALFRNVIPIMPPEARIAYYGDLFIWSMLGHHGKGKYLANLSPGFYRVHDSGLYSMTNEQQRRMGLLRTYLALFLYYKREGDVQTYSLFSWLMIKMLFKEIGYAFLLKKVANRLARCVRPAH